MIVGRIRPRRRPSSGPRYEDAPLDLLLGVHYGTSLTSRNPFRMSRSYPSSRSRFRSGLRLNSLRDIEDHPVLDLDSAARQQLAFGILARPVPYVIVNMMFGPVGTGLKASATTWS